MTTKEKQKANWMRAYEATLLLLGHEAGKVDWDTANYFYLSGKHPVESAKSMMEKNVKTDGEQL